MDDHSEKSSTRERFCVAYSSNLEYLLDELKLLDLLLYIHVLQNSSTYPGNPLDPFIENFKPYITIVF